MPSTRVDNSRPRSFGPVPYLGRMLVAIVCLSSSGACDVMDRWGESWRTSWQAARMPDRRLRLGGAQIPVELVEGWATRCRQIPFVVERVGKVRYSHDGFRALVEGQVNVACTSAKVPWYEAKDYLDAHGHLPCGWRVAWDAYAVYVHPDNPIKQITIKQFKQVLRGQIKSWGALGGPREPIMLYGPHRASRAGRVFMKIANLLLADPPWQQIDDPGKIIEAVKDNPLAMGLTVVGHSEAVPYMALKGAIDTQARVPDFETLEADKWPLCKTVWLWTPDPPDQAATDLIDYLYSDKGQAAIKATGYTPIPRDRGATRIALGERRATHTTTQP